jgi:hypothetical protein
VAQEGEAMAMDLLQQGYGFLAPNAGIWHRRATNPASSSRFLST